MLTWLTDQLDPRPLGLARIIVGAAAVLRAIVAWPILRELAEPETLKAPYLEWAPEPSIGLAVVIVVTWLVAAVLFALGWRLNVTGPLLIAVIVLTISLDLQTYSNHLYLMALLVLYLTLGDAGAGLAIRGPERPVVRWLVLLPMMQLSVVYGFAALTKLNPEFLSGRVLAGVLNGGIVTFPDSLRTPQFLMPVAAAAVFVESFLALFMWSPRFRPTAFILGLGLHITIVLFMASPGELTVFALEMLALYPLFLAPGALIVDWADDCSVCAGWVGRLRRLDVLRVVQTGGTGESNGSLRLSHAGHTSTDFAALTRIMEHLVPTLWFAPILRLPGLRGLGRRWFERRTAQPSTPVVAGGS